ncbi:hypothetical protein K431DRAFT_215160 [Polychaeton citri CBS 116435]|uniref:Uncharacterized protein n=1 Tax=Polychaeton citri CBS 116435 TaxID=1314669 RepID=A0A9P4QIM8_9PEZI|nr:hypothetical protein K431DRAFT_215160 [Polychaeton citri CBS 116435]
MNNAQEERTADVSSGDHRTEGVLPQLPRRNATLYDAVAGRVGYEGFLNHHDQIKSTSNSKSKPRTRDTAIHSKQPIPPEEVLFRRAGAPVRYQEDDIYFANRHLDAAKGQRLPESDLLKVLHAYCSDFYGSGAVRGGKASEGDVGGGEVSFRSMDETALIAMGILIEESVREAVGRTGDLALLEDGEDGGSRRGRETYWDRAAGRWRGSIIARSARSKGRGSRSRSRGTSAGSRSSGVK